MTKDENKANEYPKLNENDKRWKQQEEFDSSGAQRQLEDEDKNASIAQTDISPDNDEEKSRKV